LLFSTNFAVLPEIDGAGLVSNAQLKRAVDGLVKILGRSTVDMLVMDFERHGILLEGGGPYDMAHIRETLMRIFGPEGGRLVAERVQAALQSDANP
jgi:hypothetical protein